MLLSNKNVFTGVPVNPVSQAKLIADDLFWEYFVILRFVLHTALHRFIPECGFEDSFI